MTLEELNTLSAADLRPRLLACADVPAWSDTVLAGRPYVDVDDLEATADRAAQGFTSADVDRALAAHPRIGERRRGRRHRGRLVPAPSRPRSPVTPTPSGLSPRATAPTRTGSAGSS